MNRCTRFAVVLIACVVAAAPASAQTPMLAFGAGASIPVGDFADGAKTGWLAGGSVLFPVGQAGMWVGAEGMYGRNGISYGDYDLDGSFTLLGGNALLGMTFNPAQRVSPFVFGNVGLLSLGSTMEGSESESGVSFGAGAGLVYTLSPTASAWGLGRFMNARIDGENLQFIPLTVGVTLTLGGAR
jgi:hypothetical protein